MNVPRMTVTSHIHTNGLDTKKAPDAIVVADKDNF